MSKSRRILTRLSKGELSPLLEGSPDLSAYYEGGSTVENWTIMRQGVITRWEGTRFIKEVKDSTKDTILWPFEFSVDESYMLEVGDLYIRVYKDKAPVLNAGVHVEIVTPFAVADIRAIHMTQSADVLFLFHQSYQQRTLSRVSDTVWVLSAEVFAPPPSFETDDFIGGRLAAAANTGTSVKFHLSAATFLAADVGRQIVYEGGVASITSLTSSTEVVANILDPFTQTITAKPNTLSSVGTTVTTTAHGLPVELGAVLLTSGAQSGELRIVTAIGTVDTFTIDAAFSVNQAGVTWNSIISPTNNWFLRLSPQATLDTSLSTPVGAVLTLTAGADAFRPSDVGKYIKVYGGVVKIIGYTSALTVTGTLMSLMSETTVVNPPVTGAGTWTLEEESWSAEHGWPRTGEFFQGRLYEASTVSQPTTFWGSVPEEYDNFAPGVTAADAVEYTIASRQVNRIEWLTEKNKALFIGTSGSELSATGSGNVDALIGGDTVPQIDRLATNGCMPVQPRMARQSSLYIDRSRRKVMVMGFDIESDGQTDKELTVGAEHITESGVRLGPLALSHRLDQRLYFVREDGQLVGMTFFPEQKVVAFSRRTTLGTFGCAAVIPDSTGGADRRWTIVMRTINGVPKRYVEMFEPGHEGLTGRPWSSLQTDCAIVVTGLTGMTVTGLGHLEGATVEVVKNGSALAQEVVSSGTVTLSEALVATDVLEVGLPYTSTVETMRPSIPGQVIEGLPRSWDSLIVRVKDTRGGIVNGEPLQYAASPLDTVTLFTGDVKVTGQGYDTDGRISIVQAQPYPITVLCCVGTLDIGERD